jgi:pimeloyl-ACP methyl ester carboxylesterase
MELSSPLSLRRYGTYGPAVFVLHGGPADVGGAAPIARGLAGGFRAVEPWQRGSGEMPLTVARHVEDLHRLIESEAFRTPPAIVGHSWGAMLALAYAAAHPESAGPVALIGCGTFDVASRERMKQIEVERIDDAMLSKLERLEIDFPDPVERHLRRYELLRPTYTFSPDAAPHDPMPQPFDKRAHGETWSDMMRLQREGFYPAAFAAIRSPVLMLHGGFDPHPGEMIRDSLLPFIPDLRFRQWERCGHSPWEEPDVRDEFFATLSDWLNRQAAPSQ